MSEMLHCCHRERIVSAIVHCLASAIAIGHPFLRRRTKEFNKGRVESAVQDRLFVNIIFSSMPLHLIYVCTVAEDNNFHYSQTIYNQP